MRPIYRILVSQMWILLLSLGIAYGPQLFAQALPFVPFKIEEIRHPLTGSPILPQEKIKVVIDGKSYFDGTGSQLLVFLNTAEKTYNEAGQTLRNGNAINLLFKLANPTLPAEQLLNSLGLPIESLKKKVKPALKDCPLLTLAHMGLNPLTQKVYQLTDKIRLPQGSTLAAKDFIAGIMQQQRVLCSIGYNPFPQLESLGQDAVRTLLDARNSILGELGISRFHPSFDLQSLPEVKTAEEIAKEVKAIVEGKKIPSPQQLGDLAGKSGMSLPPELKLPDLPNIPAPTTIKPTPLDIKKRKEWKGLNEGSVESFNIYANAWLEVAGNEATEEIRGEGKAGLYVFNNPISALYAGARLKGGSDKVDGEIHLSVLGMEIFDKSFDQGNLYQHADPKLFSKGIDEGFSVQFTIVIIPVYVKVGVRGELYVGWEVVVAPLHAEGSIRPGAKVAGYLEAGIGISGILSAGVGGELTALNVTPELKGGVGLRFDSDGVPFLRLYVHSQVGFTYLSGRLYVFYECPVPRFGLPPWKIVKGTHDVFSWPGITNTLRIMSWGLDLSPFSIQVSGNMVDQTDYEELKGLQEITNLQAKAKAIGDAEQDIARKERATFEAIFADFGSEVNRRIPGDAAALQNAAQHVEDVRVQYVEELKRWVTVEI